MTRTRHTLVFLSVLLTAAAIEPAQAELVADFENLTPTQSYSGAGGGKYENGKNLSGSFTSGGATFSNKHDTFSWGEAWTGWSYSSTIDTLTPGFENQYSAYTLRDAHYQENFGDNYGVAFPDASKKAAITLDSAPIGAHITNTTYAALSMLNGDSFAKKFGGASGDDADWFMLTITGRDTAGDKTGDIDFYLADYRSADNADDYVIRDWTWVDLTGLGADTRELEFALSSTDNGTYGMNTPGFFAMDNLTTAPEPSTAALFGIALLLGAGYSVRRRRRHGNKTE